MSEWRRILNQKVGIIDMDGVLSDFIYSFSSLMSVMYPELQKKPVAIEEQAEYQLARTWPKEAVAEVWNVIKSTPWWWNGLPPLVDRQVFNRINNLAHKNRIYFVTDRVSNYPTAEIQTTRWLSYYGIYLPSVVCVPWNRKGDFASMVKATHVIEDSTRNAVDIYGSMPYGGKVFLINRKYNQAKLANITRINFVDQFLDDMEKE